MAPYGEADPFATRAHAECLTSGCFDLYHDLLVGTRVRLRATAENLGERVAEPRRYAHVVVKRLLVDRVRNERVSRGYPARPGRLDGSAGRVRDALESADRDPVRASWLVALLRMLQDYAHKAGRVAATWPLDGWTMEKSHYDGHPRVLGHESRDEVRADIAEVIRTASAVLGPAWVHVNIHHPLLTALEPSEIDEAIAAPQVDLELTVLSSWLRAEYQEGRRRGLSSVDALRKAAARVTGHHLEDLTEAVQDALRELDRELERSA